MFRRSIVAFVFSRTIAPGSCTACTHDPPVPFGVCCLSSSPVSLIYSVFTLITLALTDHAGAKPQGSRGSVNPAALRPYCIIRAGALAAAAVRTSTAASSLTRTHTLKRTNINNTKQSEFPHAVFRAKRVFRSNSLQMRATRGYSILYGSPLSVQPEAGSAVGE